MENYTFVEIGGKKHPIKFGFNALRKYSMKTGTTLAQLNQIGDNMGLNDALVLIHCGIEDGYRAAKQECKLSIDDLKLFSNSCFKFSILELFSSISKQKNQ